MPKGFLTSLSLEENGVDLGWASPFIPALDLAITLITDPAQARAEFAGALAQLRAKEIPNLILGIIDLEALERERDLEVIAAADVGSVEGLLIPFNQTVGG